MKNKLILVISLLSAELSVNAIDLFATYQQATVFNADYLKAIAANLAGQENPNIARGALLPQLNANASLTENYLDAGGLYAYYHQPIYAAQLNQVVFDFSKFSTYAKSKFAAQLSELQLHNARMQLMLNVTQAYFAVLYAADVVLATQMTKRALEQQLMQAKAAFQLGTVTLADVNDTQAGYDAAVAKQLQEENSLIYQKNIFRNLTGVNPDLIQPLQSGINLVLPKPQDVNAWAQIAREANLEVKIANQQVLMAKEDISIAKSGHLPSLNFMAQYQYQDTGAIDNSNASMQQLEPIISVPGSPLSSFGVGYVGLQLSIPISAGGRINSETRRAAANFATAQEQLISVARQIDQQVRNAYWQVQNGVSLVLAQQAAMQSAKTKLDSDKLAYQVGIRNSVDLVSAQKNYFQAFQHYQQSRYQYLIATTQLNYMGGIIDDKFLQQLNANIQQ